MKFWRTWMSQANESDMLIRKAGKKIFSFSCSVEAQHKQWNHGHHTIGTATAIDVVGGSAAQTILGQPIRFPLAMHLLTFSQLLHRGSVVRLPHFRRQHCPSAPEQIPCVVLPQFKKRSRNFLFISSFGLLHTDPENFYYCPCLLVHLQASEYTTFSVPVTWQHATA